jgi:hypothetical protein
MISDEIQNEFEMHALVSQEIKRVITHHVANLDRRFDEVTQEGLDVIAHRVGSIIGRGDNDPEDWYSIAAYAVTVGNRLKKNND